MALPDGTQTIAYCPNPGSLEGCLVRGSQALLWDSCNAKRKLRYTLRAVRVSNVWIGTDTHIANRIVESLILKRVISGLDCYDTIKREVKIGGVKIDFMLTAGDSQCLVEVKSSTVACAGVARFPDSITVRGLRQLQELAILAAAGIPVTIIYLAQRSDVTSFTVTDEFYPEYAAAHKEAVGNGVKVIALAVRVHQKGFSSPEVLHMVNA